MFEKYTDIVCACIHVLSALITYSKNNIKGMKESTLQIVSVGDIKNGNL